MAKKKNNESVPEDKIEETTVVTARLTASTIERIVVAYLEGNRPDIKGAGYRFDWSAGEGTIYAVDVTAELKRKK